MLDKAKSETGITESREQAQFPVNFVEAQKRTARLFAETSELAAKATREIIEHQTELLRLETEQIVAAFAPQKIGEGFGARRQSLVSIDGRSKPISCLLKRGNSMT